MRSSLSSPWKGLLDILFPKLCALCGVFGTSEEQERLLCSRCLAHIPLHSSFFCFLCRGRLQKSTNKCHPKERMVLFAATDYATEEIAHLIWRMKYKAEPAIANTLGFLLAESFRPLAHSLSHPLVVPVPLHRSKERSRGFNQAERIATHFSRRLSLPLNVSILRRVRNTNSQKELKGREAREKNVCGSFVAHPNSSLATKTIVLIDDVSTSGSTLRDAARALREAGARTIVAVVTAKA